jgi:hypothetical protein
MSNCEYCGALLAPGDKVCSRCGAPVSGQRISESVKDFESLLIGVSDGNSISYLRKSTFQNASVLGKIGIILLWILLFPVMLFIYIFRKYVVSSRHLSESDNKKANIIGNYTFTNDRETLLEALIFIRTQIDILGEMKKDGYTAFWIKLWTSKAEQTYEKSKVALGDDTTAKDIFSKIKKESETLLNRNRLSFGLTLAAAVLAVCILSYSIARPYIYYYRVIHNVEIIPGRLSHMQQKNEIDVSNIMLSGLLDTCFSVGDDNAYLEFMDDDKYLDVTLSLVCKSSLVDEINSQLLDKIPELDPYDPLTGLFLLNGAVAEYMGKYSIGEIQATDLFETMLKAKPGDKIDVHLLHEVQTYDQTSDFERVMEVSNLLFSISLTYKHVTGSGDEDIEFLTIK